MLVCEIVCCTLFERIKKEGRKERFYIKRKSAIFHYKHRHLSNSNSDSEGIETIYMLELTAYRVESPAGGLDCVATRQ